VASLLDAIVRAARGAGRALRPVGLCRLCALRCQAPVCADCVAQYLGDAPARCRRCALALHGGGTLCAACLLEPPPFTVTLALGDYAPPQQRLIHQLKYGGEPMLGRWLGALLARRWQAARLPRPTLVLAVPLSAARLRQRGYNQAWEIARGVARELRVPARAALLRRDVERAPQTGLALARRAANVRGAFSANPEAARRLRGARVLLVDDVMTSGSTVSAAARVLLDAGAAEVTVAVALRTPDWRDG
jgi:ComF family protein